MIGRWGSVDPLAENHYSHTPYNYVLGNPISLIDPFGLDTIGVNNLDMNTYREDVDVVELEEAQVNSSVSMTSGERMGWRSSRGLDPFTNLNGSSDYGALYDHQRYVNYRHKMNSVWDPQKAVYDVVMFWATGEVGGVVGNFALKGIRSIVGGLFAKGGTTVLGHYPAYTKLATELGARRFQIPTSVWNKMSAAEQWTANTKFLDRMILRGDNIRLATPLNQVKPGSFFQKELNYLFDKGYKVSSDGLWLVK